MSCHHNYKGSEVVKTSLVQLMHVQTSLRICSQTYERIKLVEVPSQCTRKPFMSSVIYIDVCKLS